MEFGRFMGSLHPILIHFPIALLLTAVFLETLGFVLRHDRLSWSGRVCLLLGIGITLLAFVCGNFAEVWAARSGVSIDALERHEFLATITSWTFVALTGWRLMMTPETPRKWMVLWLVIAWGACTGLGVTGYYGGDLVYQQGAGVQVAAAPPMPVEDDLRQLMQRQDADSVFYSNQMHAFFGWLVLVLSGILLVDKIWPKAGEIARRFAPPAILFGGIYLMIFSDRDAWPLYWVKPYLPITDKEVLLHKTYATLMILIGLRGTWIGLRTQGEQRAQGMRVQDRVMAVFALVGGALLFTHIHSVAPFANNAVGVYVHHAVMGAAALAIGMVKLLDDRAKRPNFGRQIAYPALMCLQGVLLVNYNEGLPWFLGYPRMSVEAPSGGSVTPIGPYRGELIFTQADGTLVVRLWQTNKDVPAPAPATPLHATIRTGYEVTRLDLLPCDAVNGHASQFSAKAAFLMGKPLFQVQLEIDTLKGKVSGEFEPWVDHRIAVPPEKLKFACSMHPSIGGDRPGRCSLCDMPLEPMRPPRPLGKLHDDEFTMEFDHGKAPLIVGQETTLSFKPLQSGAVARLDVVHTQKLHLLIVSRDLSFFDHVHPQQTLGGRFEIPYRFPAGGDYILFGDCTPMGERNQVFRMVAHVEGLSSPHQLLETSQSGFHVFDVYRAALDLHPKEVVAGGEAVLTVTVKEGDQPVTDLQPLLGASGHCVAIHENGEDYIHIHPVEALSPAHIGPMVSFHASFPRRGRYRVWAQFQHRGKMVTFPFTVDVG